MKSLDSNQKNLTRRYLSWCYKTTKEDLDRIDRYFTQLTVDDFILNKLRGSKEFKVSANKDFAKLVNDFGDYRNKKEERVLAQKFENQARKVLQPQYLYLQKRFQAIEAAIVHFLGDKELKKIIDAYEREMTTRILQSREHK
ncbi:MAG: hypothetical protein HQL26_07115 [Candidatus Omnitrophica bacterium]|nr:hypothetical protein [Candidatus Omnitrophota bacterium]